MSRLDYDVVFYRVLCITLVAVASTFIVILTNVFVDIDGLLSNRNKYIPETSPIPETFILYNKETPLDASKYLISNEDRNYDSGVNPFYRTKRSIETVYPAKSPSMKNMLTRRLASLLEELDKEEARKEVDTTEGIVKNTKNEGDHILGIRNDDLLHLAMHNILLQGLIGHMDLNDVYKKVHVLVQTFNKKNTQDEKLDILNTIVNPKVILREISDEVKHADIYNEEHKLFEELLKCKKLEEQIAKTTLSNERDTTNKNTVDKDSKVFVQTVIEITESDKPEGPNRTHPKQNVEGLIKLIYNGKTVKIHQMNDKKESQKTSESIAIHDREQVKNPVVDKAKKKNAELNITLMNQNNHRQQPSKFFNKVLEEYFKKHSIPSNENLQNSADIESIKTQRLKRQIKIRYSDNVTTSSKTKPVHDREKKDDDDLYIEIETHFDGKGIKGEKKKKLVRSLIDKIQKALHSDIVKNHDSVEHIKFVKRIQNPIYNQHKISLLKKLNPLEPVEHRQLDPIGKTFEALENIADRHGDSWRKRYNGPNFLSISKSVNSAEMNELNIDYDSVLQNGISKRLQKPLNTESDNDDAELLNPGSSNVTLLLNDIDGSGFSVGFNQYKGEPPDKESMKMFNGVEHLIREYHKKYDQADNMSNESTINNKHNFVERGHAIAKRNVENLHNVYRRSITEVGTNYSRNYYNTNTRSIVYKKYPSLDKYLNIFNHYNFKIRNRISNDKKLIHNARSNSINTLSKNLSLNEVPIIVDERILNEKLKPSEILTIANLINRKRRSLSVKKISNLKSKIKLNRFLNTKAMTHKKVYLINKRNKRQVNNIRIVARHKPMTPQKNSDENIFFISRENTYLDKEIIKSVETADPKITQKTTEYFDEESPFDNIYRIQNPNIPTLNENVYNTVLSSNKLMSQYPHIFLDKSSYSKEEGYFDENQYNTNDKPYRIEASTKPAIRQQEIETTTEQFATAVQSLSVPRVKEIVGAIMPPLSRNNYKITVKMSPKNKTNTNARFKEVHTMVNKSFDENGLRYYTLLNVSQISKIETLNKTDYTQGVVQPQSNHLIDQQKQIKALLKLHKKSVDLQLNSLLRESNNLAKMIDSNQEYNIKKPVKLLTKIDNGLEPPIEDKLINPLRKLQDTPNAESTYLTIPPTTLKPITQLPSTTEIPNIDKSLIVDSIKQNEKVTFEILSKIETNTQILQKFLQKLSDKLELDKKDHTLGKTTEKSAIEMKLDLSTNWKTNENAFFIPNELKNDTIPFVYAYQQSIPVKDRTSPQLASLVYHGHIHSKTNAAQNYNNKFKDPAPKIEPNALDNTVHSKKKFNEPKLLLNDLNNFKVIKNDDRLISANIKINTTSNLRN